METEDLIKLPASSSSETETENDGVHNSGGEPVGGDSLPEISGVREDGEYTKEDGEYAREDGEYAREDGEYAREDGEYAREDGENGRITDTVNIENEDNQGLLVSEFDEDMDISPPPSQVCAELTKTVSVEEKVTCLSSEMLADNGFSTAEQGNSLSNHKEDIPFAGSQEINATALSGVKRPRTTVDKQQSSVQVIYNSLTRESRRKLEELLQQWSQWDARHSSSSIDSNEVLESGEETYFPALHVGIDKALAVSFWMDNQTKNSPNKEFIPLDGNSVPFYDRGFSLALTSTDGSSNLERGFEVLDTSRCFNCGSYSHSLKDCPKPRDNVAVNSARKQLKSRRNQNPGSRNPTRYYQSSPKGKFDGLRPGVLDAETRRLLGLGELDPPPWLNRMREIGYPPGYLDPENEDQPSGITIFADEESKEETEEGEILGAGSPVAGYPDPPTKKSVEFPGINAPIPEYADKRRWEAGSSSFNVSRSHSYRRYDHSSESISRGHYYEQARSREYQDDGPPGCDLRPSQSLSGYSQRYGSYDSSYTTQSPSSNSSGRRSPSSGRSMTDRGRKSTQDDNSNRGVYGSLP